MIRPRAVSNEEEGFGLNAGLKHYYYRVAIPLSDLLRFRIGDIDYFNYYFWSSVSCK